MNKISGILGSIAAFLLLAGNPVFAEEAIVSDEQKQQISAACKDESKGSEYPQEYVESCIEEKIQALIEEKLETKKEES